ncbi:MAG TPA: PASTA domain-containing protein [Solirubrobacteraceae bacterium]|nr:PASTA domain-containing protein [Solirubrobacteraceae bacterium]
MPARRLITLLASGAALVLALSATVAVGATSATMTEQVTGTLTGVGAGQRSLDVVYDNAHVVGCGISAVTPTVTETNTSVDVTLTAQVNTLPPDVACPAVLIRQAITVPLSHPLGGRHVEGLTIRGGALALTTIEPRRMPSLVGLSPRDARLMLSAGPPPLLGLVTHDVRGSGAGLARVISQRPAAGSAFPASGGIVILTVAR